MGNGELIVMQYEECLRVNPKGDFLLQVNGDRPLKISKRKARALVVKRESASYWNSLEVDTRRE
jgi:hypothetical protein